MPMYKLIDPHDLVLTILKKVYDCISQTLRSSKFGKWGATSLLTFVENACARNYNDKTRNLISNISANYTLQSRNTSTGGDH